MRRLPPTTFGSADTHSVSYQWLRYESEIRAGWDSLRDDEDASVRKPRIVVLDPLHNLTAEIVGSGWTIDAKKKELVATALDGLLSQRQSVLRLRHGFEDGERWWWHQIAERLGTTRESSRAFALEGMLDIRQEVRQHLRS